MDLVKTKMALGFGWCLKGLSLVPPLLLLAIRPLGMDWRQSAIVALLILVITWWCTGWVNKNICSCLLLAGFVLLSAAPLRTIFFFPLSDTFLLIALTYLFSRGIVNSGVAERFLEPILFKFATTPLKVIISTVVMLSLTMYAIPQPLARLVIVADILLGYLKKTDVCPKTQAVLMFNVFVSYIFVNICTLRADIILNTTAVNVAGLSFSDGDWIRYMTVPSIIYLAVAVVLILLLFRKDLLGIKLTVRDTKRKVETRQTGRDGVLLALIIITILLWVTESVHGIPASMVTLASVALMFALGVLKPVDMKALDVSMLLFLTAAMSIGGVMKSNGTADIVFSSLRALIPATSTIAVILTIMCITICMHMFLGSNTTTISVVIPGIVLICGDMLPVPIIMCIIYITLTTQWLFPFHSVGMIVGVSKDYFPASYLLRMGIPLTIIVFAAVLGLYLPWWSFMGLLT